MGKLQSVFRAITDLKLGHTQQSTPFSANSHPGPNFPGWRWPVDDNDYRSAVQQARLSSLVEACIGYRSENAVSTPWILKERKKDGDTLTEHPVLDLLNMPNPYDDGHVRADKDMARPRSSRQWVSPQSQVAHRPDG